MAIHIHDIEAMIKLLKRTRRVLKGYNSLINTTDIMLLLEDIDNAFNEMEEE